MPYRDEFDDPQTDRNIAQTLEAVRRQVFLKTRGPAVAGGILFVAALILAAVIFFTYPGQQEPEIIPVIQADARPFKVIPQDPGGMVIPHRDSTLFSSMRNSNIEDNEIENLFEDETPEEPLPRSQLFAGLNMEDEELNQIEPSATTEEMLEKGMGDEETLFGEMDEPSEGAFASSRESVIQETGNSLKKEDEGKPQEEVKLEKAAIVEPKPEPEPEQQETKLAALEERPISETVKPKSDGTHYVQIGAVKSAAAAEKGWGAYKAEYSPVLTGLDHRIQRADLGEKGIYFRIQAGPVPKAKADSICAQIKEKKPGGCIIVSK